MPKFLGAWKFGGPWEGRVQWEPTFPYAIGDIIESSELRSWSEIWWHRIQHLRWTVPRYKRVVRRCVGQSGGVADEQRVTEP